MAAEGSGLTVLVLDVDGASRVDVAAAHPRRSRLARRAFAKWAVRVVHQTFYAPGQIRHATYRAEGHGIVGLPVVGDTVDLIVVNASGCLASDAKHAAALAAVSAARREVLDAPMLAAVLPPARARRTTDAVVRSLLAAGATDYVIARRERLAAHRLRLMLAAWSWDVGPTGAAGAQRLLRNLIAEGHFDATAE